MYCKVHQEYEDRLLAARNKRYDKARSKDKEYKFYKSSKWIRFRKYILSRDNYLCQMCLNNNKLTEATLVHHIKPVRDNWELRLKENNVISVCDECHNKIHKKK